MKYTAEDYNLNDTGFFGFDDTEIENYKEKLVKCRKPHKCMGGCEKEIPIGTYAVRETGFMEGQPMSSYICTDCIDKWLDEINPYDEEDRGER